MTNQEHRVPVDNGKYTFVVPADEFVVSILRHGEPWHGPQADASSALHAIMCELDAARVVIEAARDLVITSEMRGRGDEIKGLVRALQSHKGLVGDRQRPSRWARPECRCEGGDAGGHGRDCDRRP